MSRLFDSAQLCEEALREIGEYSPYDTGADSASFLVTLNRLDLLISELAGTYNLWWFVPESQQFPLEAGETTYPLLALLDTPLQFVQHVYLLRGGKQTELRQIRRAEYDQYVADVPTGGAPEMVYIERNDAPSMVILPAPAEGDEVIVTGQKYAEDLVQSQGVVAHGFPAAWQRAIILQLAADIGDGPVRTLDDGKLDRLQKRAAASFRRLDSFNNREQVRRVRVTRPRDF